MSAFVPSGTAKAAGWVTDGVYPRLGRRVTSVVPAGFEAYVRVLFPFSGVADASVPWRQVADEAGLPLGPLTVSDELLNGVPEARKRQLQLELPLPSELPTLVADTLIEILQVRTTTPARCYFALWEGYGDLAEHHREAASFTTPARRWYLHTARVADAVAGFDTVTGVNTKPPDLWWPEDKRWFVGGDTDLPCVYVGCTSNTAAELLRSRLEAFTVEPTDPPRG